MGGRERSLGPMGFACEEMRKSGNVCQTTVRGPPQSSQCVVLVMRDLVSDTSRRGVERYVREDCQGVDEVSEGGQGRGGTSTGFWWSHIRKRGVLAE